MTNRPQPRGIPDIILNVDSGVTFPALIHCTIGFCHALFPSSLCTRQWLAWLELRGATSLYWHMDVDLVSFLLG